MNDQLLIDVYTRFAETNHARVDDLLCDPEQREAFLARARQTLGDLPEKDVFGGSSTCESDRSCLDREPSEV
jgi:hypothetical protein